MLTYEEEDDNWNNWDGGYWGKDIYNTNKKKSYKCCIFLVSCLTCWITLLILYLTVGYQLVCSITFIDKISLCSKNNTVLKNSSSFLQNTSSLLQNNSNFTINNSSLLQNNSNFTINNSSLLQSNSSFPINNSSLLQNTDINDESRQKNILLNQTYNSSSSLFYQNIKSEIETKTIDKSFQTGEAIAISVGSVFGFIIFIVGSIYIAKKGTGSLKSYCTYRTASHHNDIQLTEEEQRFYQVKNPLQEAIENNQGGLFQEAVSTIKKAIEKDRNRDFEEAIELYNKGIDTIIRCLKSDFNSNDRFAIAKKIDIYVKRVNYITNCVENQKLIKDINNKL